MTSTSDSLAIGDNLPGSTLAAPLDVSTTRDAYQILAERYDLQDSRRYGWSRRYSTEFMEELYCELADVIPKGVRRVLDVGCGNGGFASALRTRRPEVEYVGVDLMEEHIRLARSRMQGDAGCEFRCCDFWELFLPGSSSSSNSNSNNNNNKNNSQNNLSKSSNINTTHDTNQDHKSPAPSILTQKLQEQSQPPLPSWDFVTSVGCVFSHCDLTHTAPEQQLMLLDAINRSANRGFALLCHGDRDKQGISMAAALGRVQEYVAQSNGPVRNLALRPPPLSKEAREPGDAGDADGDGDRDDGRLGESRQDWGDAEKGDDDEGDVLPQNGSLAQKLQLTSQGAGLQGRGCSYFVSPYDGRGYKPFFAKVQFRHRLVVLLR